MRQRLREALLFIHRHRVEKGYIPSYRELGVACGSAGGSGASNHAAELVAQLVAAGCVRVPVADNGRRRARCLVIDYESEATWDVLYRWEVARTGGFAEYLEGELPPPDVRRRVLLGLAEEATRG